MNQAFTRIPGSVEAQCEISLVIPAYNVEGKIVELLHNIKSRLEPISRHYELIVVNDGSDDNTLGVLENEVKVNPFLTVISNSTNLGKGHAVKTGIMHSKGKIVIYIDGDGGVDPSQIPFYINELEKYDLVIASKRHPLSNITSTLSRRFLSRIFNLLVLIGTGLKIKDTQVGLKAGNGDILRTIFKVVNITGYAFDVELLMIACVLHLKIKELPIELNCAGGFKISEIFNMLREVVVISYRHRVSRMYVKQVSRLATEAHATGEPREPVRIVKLTSEEFDITN
jgi:dolichyl-phosphate beta-glucosyltransferase